METQIQIKQKKQDCATKPVTSNNKEKTSKIFENIVADMKTCLYVKVSSKNHDSLHFLMCLTEI